MFGIFFYLSVHAHNEWLSTLIKCFVDVLCDMLPFVNEALFQVAFITERANCAYVSTSASEFFTAIKLL